MSALRSIILNFTNIIFTNFLSDCLPPWIPLFGKLMGISHIITEITNQSQFFQFMFQPELIFL